MAPSLWERLRVGELCSGMGRGGLLVVYRITYPHTPSRRIAYPPELETRGKDGLKGQRMGGGEQKTPNLLFTVDVEWQQDRWTRASG